MIGGGELRVFFDEGIAEGIRTSTPGHSIRGVGPGASTVELRKAGFVRYARKRWFVLPRVRHGRLVFARAKDGRVQWVSIALSDT